MLIDAGTVAVHNTNRFSGNVLVVTLKPSLRELFKECDDDALKLQDNKQIQFSNLQYAE